MKSEKSTRPKSVKMTKAEQMSRIKTKNTKPEMIVRRALYQLGVRYRLHRKDLPGKPDIYIGKLRLAVFINGCFWHGHNCRRGARPISNKAFWNIKIDQNQARDAAAIEMLAEIGIKSTTIWECSLKDCNSIVNKIADQYKQA